MKQPVFEGMLRATLLPGIRKLAETGRIAEKERP